MTTNKICPCCSNSMLRCLERDRSYWFCRHCWQEMPDLTKKTKAELQKAALSDPQNYHLSIRK
ncbi:hypothetical protein [Myxosarcina sp. GI1]|uniref:hypothetical protein n=1 Tax=Myxosarcina sp. GI1 TaxID=1541065 RepID=UPI0012E01B3B|nr:hypothetical protein [Myxosarcina sp. GI1]